MQDQNYVVYVDNGGHRVEETITAQSPQDAQRLFESMHPEFANKTKTVLLEKYHN